MAEGFLSRWSQRKRAVAQGAAPAEPAGSSPPTSSPGTAPQRLALPPDHGARREPAPATQVGANQMPAPQPVPPPAPTLADTADLTPASDFKPFVAAHVAPEVRNAAMKKLFADPHFNVMDRLDTYIDDYSLPAPLPAAMLRQMASAQFMGLFENEPGAPMPTVGVGGAGDAPQAATASAPLSAPAPTVQAAPAAQPASERPVAGQPVLSSPDSLCPTDPHHAHPDLQLQPHHAAGPRALGRGAA